MQKAQKYKNLILDLRDNGGGAVVNLQHLLGFFLSPDTSIGTFVKKELVNNYVLDTGGNPSDVVKDRILVPDQRPMGFTTDQATSYTIDERFPWARRGPITSFQEAQARSRQPPFTTWITLSL